MNITTHPGRDVAGQEQAMQQRRQRSQRGRNRKARKMRPTAERLDGYAEILSNHHRHLALVAAIYQEQPSVYLLQIEETVRYLMELRRVAGAARAYLDQLEPSEIQRIQPIGCIGKLASLDYLLTELLFNVAMFAQVCQAISPERVQVHITIRAKCSALLRAYDDATAMLGTLAEKAYQPSKVSESEESRTQRREEVRQ
jgi:hypothetical protein